MCNIYILQLQVFTLPGIMPIVPYGFILLFNSYKDIDLECIVVFFY